MKDKYVRCSRAWQPPLTAVHLPFAELGRIAATRIIQTQPGPEVNTKSMTRLTVTLHDRHSGGKA